MSDPNTRWAMLNLLNALSSGALALEILTDDLAQVAVEVDDDASAELVLGVLRRHRVRALELQGQYAALSAEYTARYHSAP